ncbi:MAG: metallophosphoesterase [Myxococcales bacterium]
MAAVFPGLLVPGAGHFVLGQRDDGKNFLILDAVALALIGLGFGGQALSGGADRLSPLTLTPAVAGISLVSVAWLADILGSAHGTAEWLAPRDPPGSLSLSVGYTGLFGSQLAFHHGLGLEASWRYGPFSAEPWGSFNPSLSYYGAGARLSLVVWRDGDDPVTRLTIGGAVTHHRFRPDRYSTTVGELHGELRLNLKHLAQTLRNVWLVARLGAGLEAFAYDAKSFDWADLTPVLVLEVGGGARVHERVTVEFVYRSRKDELPGGDRHPRALRFVPGDVRAQGQGDSHGALRRAGGREVRQRPDAMDRFRIAALLSLAFAAACLDPTSERTRRDFEEIGWADLGGVRAHVDQGVALQSTASSVRFRAGAPEVTLDLTSTDTEDRTVRVVLENVDEASTLSEAALSPTRGRKSVSFDVNVPPGATVTVRSTRTEAQQAQPFRFGWVGDVQGGYEKFGGIREDVNLHPEIEFVLFAGDVTQNGTQGEIDEFVRAADALDVPWYSVFGNHETTFNHGEEFQRSVGRLNFAFDYKGARFVVLDTAAATVSDRVYTFLDGWMAKPGAALRVAGMHIPPLDYEGLRDAGFASRAEGAKMLSKLTGGGTDLLLCGHLHTLRFSANAGMQVVVSGNGGVSIADRLDGTGMHYLSVLARPDEEKLEVTVVRVP